MNFCPLNGARRTYQSNCRSLVTHGQIVLPNHLNSNKNEPKSIKHWLKHVFT